MVVVNFAVFHLNSPFMTELVGRDAIIKCLKLHGLKNINVFS